MAVYAAAAAAAVSVGNAVAQLRIDLADRIARDRLGAQHEADMIAHSALVGLLGSAYPGVPIVSEEDQSHDDSRPDDYFLIDPIDGTASWSGGFDGFVCQIARITCGEAVFGVIHCPVRQKTWVAERGLGATLNSEPLPLLVPRERPPVVVDNYPTPRGVAARLVDRLGSCTYVESGSIGLKAAMVASGEADIFIKDVVVRDWDVAPASCLLHEVGGFVRLPGNTEYLFSGDFEKPGGIVIARDSALGESTAVWMRQGS